LWTHFYFFRDHVQQPLFHTWVLSSSFSFSHEAHDFIHTSQCGCTWFSSFPFSHMLVQHITLVFAAQEPFSALRSDLKQAIPAIHLCIKWEVHFSLLHSSPSSFFLKFLQHLSLFCWFYSSKKSYNSSEIWVIANSDWVEPKRESVCLEVFYLPSKFHVNRSRFAHQKVGRSKLSSIWTEILNSNR